LSALRENLLWAPYLKGVPTLSERDARLAANPSRMNRRDRDRISKKICRLKRQIREAREADRGPS